MTVLVIDENLPRSLAPALEQLNYTAKDVRDHSLRGKPDEEIYQFAQHEEAVLVSGDTGFSDTLRFPLGKHYGIVVVRLPNELSAEKRVQEIVRAFTDLKGISLKGALVVITPGKVRIRHKQSASSKGKGES